MPSKIIPENTADERKLKCSFTLLRVIKGASSKPAMMVNCHVPASSYDGV